VTSFVAIPSTVFVAPALTTALEASDWIVLVLPALPVHWIRRGAQIFGLK